MNRNSYPDNPAETVQDTDSFTRFAYGDTDTRDAEL